MNDDLNAHLGAWQAPAPSDRAARRIAALLDDTALPGPLLAPARRPLAVPLAFAVAVTTLVVMMAPRRGDAPALLRHDVRVTRALVETPGVPAAAQSTATAVSAIDLEGFELVARPHIRLKRMTP